MSNISIEDVMAKFGGRPAAAAALKITPQAIQKWMDKGRVPIERVADVESATGISRHDLRPDIFGPASPKEDAAA